MRSAGCKSCGVNGEEKEREKLANFIYPFDFVKNANRFAYVLPRTVQCAHT